MRSTRLLTILCLLLITPTVYAQRYTAADIHAHNDYAQPQPFYHAYDKGTGAIEADVFVRDGKLLVAHSAKEISPANTLHAMYLAPLAERMRQRPRKLNLLIDIKEDYAPAIELLIQELKPLMPYIKPGTVNIIITGNRPLPRITEITPPGLLLTTTCSRCTHRRNGQELLR
jgi:hypothetical protein